MNETHVHRVRSRLPAGKYWARLRTVLFGDRVGLSLFLVTLCVTMLYWRAGVFITDTETLIGTLNGVSEGHLWIDRAGDGPLFDAPGAERRGEFVYGRNYGQIFFSLPFLWALQAIEHLADLRVALIALWHLLALALAVQIGHLTDYYTDAVVGGSIIVLTSFILHFIFATQFTSPRHALLALQLGSLVATGFTAVVMYRLVAFQWETRLGVFAGLACVLVLPVGFWASIPKRHPFSVLACLLVLYLFARSRSPDSRMTMPVLGSVPACRAGAYATVAFLTWIHAAEGAFVFLALVAVDLPTATENDRRTVAFVGAVFVLAMVPTLATNQLVNGSPLRPPREGAGVSVSSPAEPRTDTSESLLDSIRSFWLVAEPLWILTTLWRILALGLAVIPDVSRMSQIFVRSSGTLDTGTAQFRAINLSVLESAPLLGSLIGIGVATVIRRVRSLRGMLDRTSRSRLRLHSLRTWLGTIAPTAVLAVGIVAGYLIIFLPNLPVHVQVTQRYLLPIYPLALYLLMYSDTFRALLQERVRTTFWSYLGGVLAGLLLFVGYLFVQGLAIADAGRASATMGVVVAGAVTATLFGHTLTDRAQSLTAVIVGLACATGTLFLLVSGLFYFAGTGELVYPLVKLFTDLFNPF